MDAVLSMADKAEMALRIVREAPLIAYDSETSGLDWKRNSVCGYVVTAPQGPSLYIAIRHGGGGNLAGVKPLTEAAEENVETHPFERALAAAFEQRRQMGFRTVAHNAKFDAHLSLNHGIDIFGDLVCTSLTIAILDEFSMAYSLDMEGKRRGLKNLKLGDDLYAHLAEKFGGQAKKDQMSNFWKLPGNDPLAVEYAVTDGFTTLELWERQEPELVRDGLWTAARLEYDLQRTVVRMERRGIAFDIDKLARICEKVDAEAELLLRSFPAGFNPGSPKDVEKAFADVGHTSYELTPTGKKSFNEVWLLKSPLGEQIVEIRKLKNFRSKFADPMRDKHVFKGRIHTDLSQLRGDEHGTVTARFASSDPNLQAVYKRNKKLAKLARSAFVADPGYEFGDADYKQCEPRLFAHFSKSQSLIEGYSQTPAIDMHQMVAEMLGVERDPTAKRMNQGIMTCMGETTFAEHMGWNRAYAKEMMLKFDGIFPELRQFQQDAMATIRERKFVRSLLGRMCRLQHGNARWAYKAVNRLVQTGNADILKNRMLAADRYLESEGDKVQLLLTVHDSIEWQHPLGEEGRRIADEMIRIMKDVQTPPFNLRVPFDMDVGYGPNWAVATFGSDQ